VDNIEQIQQALPEIISRASEQLELAVADSRHADAAYIATTLNSYSKAVMEWQSRLASKHVSTLVLPNHLVPLVEAEFGVDKSGGSYL
jgi:hypothetical protein